MAVDWGTIPTASSDGEYKGRATYLRKCGCGCGRSGSYFRDTDKLCTTQTISIRRHDLGLGGATITSWLIAAAEGDAEAQEWIEAIDEVRPGDDSLILPGGMTIL